jgi:hypothetical protein
MTEPLPEAPQLTEQPDLELIGDEDGDAPLTPGLCLPFA